MNFAVKLIVILSFAITPLVAQERRLDLNFIESVDAFTHFMESKAKLLRKTPPDKVAEHLKLNLTKLYLAELSLLESIVKENSLTAFYGVDWEPEADRGKDGIKNMLLDRITSLRNKGAMDPFSAGSLFDSKSELVVPVEELRNLVQAVKETRVHLLELETRHKL